MSSAGTSLGAVTVEVGLPPALTEQAARLYWEAFGGKLGQVMGPEARALAFLVRTIRHDHCVVARDTGAEAGASLVGLAGFKTPQGSFAGGTLADLRAIYGWWGGYWRGALLALLSREVDNDRFLLDGICVTRQARGAGIGVALLQALYAEGRARGYDAIRLDVIDTNWRARALYEREGFMATKTVGLGVLRYVFGFRSATTMVRPI